MIGEEIQLTFGPGNFFLNHRQCFSPDDKWIVYDTRADDTQISCTGTIGIVHISSGECRDIYHTANQSDYGPGVGAATFSPVEQKVLFLHGPRNATRENPYGFTRRSGVSVDLDRAFFPVFLDARNVNFPFTKGALRGGTHAHAYSGDGKWISFTYNDYVIGQLGFLNREVKDLRTVGVMMPGTVEVHSPDNIENYSGEMFSAVIAEVTETPAWGSNEIEKAFDETWIGTDGYVKEDGRKQYRAVAFQGDTRETNGQLKTEVFVAELPRDISIARPGKPLEGTQTSRPNVPEGVHQRRITFSTFGLSGPRHWLRSTSDGSRIGFLSNDGHGQIQLFSVSPNGGPVLQITHHPFSIQSQFNFSPDDRLVVYLADNRIYITDLVTHTSMSITPRFADDEKPMGAIVWSNNGQLLAYNRLVVYGTEKHPQIFILKGTCNFP